MLATTLVMLVGLISKVGTRDLKLHVIAEWLLTPAIQALWEAKAGESQGQDFQTSLANIVKSHLY